MYKPPKHIKTIQQAINCAYETNPKWQKYAGLPSCTIKSSTDWFTKEIYSPGFAIADIDKPHIWKHLVIEMQKRGKANETINKVMSNNNSALSHCYTLYPEAIKHGPWNLRSKYGGAKNGLPPTKGRVVFYELNEIHQLASVARRLRGEDLEDAILFSALTGARQGEVLNLRAKSVDLRQNMVSFWQTKNGGSWRHIPIEASIVKPMIERRLEADPDPEHKVFGDYFASRFSLRDQFLDIIDKAMPEKMYPWHTLRNTFIITMADLGYSVVDICAMMDHSSPQVTERYLIARNKNRQNMISDLTGLLHKQQLVSV